jgi:hypothetical protein
MDDPTTRDYAAPDTAARHPPQPLTGAAVLISLRIEPGEPITGTLTSNNRTEAAPFCGWMELIAAINDRRDGQGQ